MLVMNGERFARLAARSGRGSRARRELRQQPAASSYCRAPRAGKASARSASIVNRPASPATIAAARAYASRRARGRRRRGRRSQPSASASRGPCTPAGPRRTSVQRPRGQRRERQQVEPIVLEHRRERPRVAGADELEIARGNLEARHVAVPAVPSTCRSSATSEQLDSCGFQGAGGTPVDAWDGRFQNRRADGSMSRCGSPAPAQDRRWNR